MWSHMNVFHMQYNLMSLNTIKCITLELHNWVVKALAMYYI